MARIFFFTSLSAYRSHARITGIFALEETPTIMEFQRAFNEEPLHAFEQSVTRPSEARVLAGAALAQHNGWRECQLIPEERAMPAKKLSDAEITALLPKAKGWSVVNGKLHREFACKDFVAAFGNMTRVALVAESMNHHPEWFNVWNKVVIDLNTHSVKGISDYDFVLAEKINEIFGA
jgi:4a-hydroxytetrahydrobiopterin dehydratase